jgi:uncharacterized protein (DUF1800 family)
MDYELSLNDGNSTEVLPEPIAGPIETPSGGKIVKPNLIALGLSASLLAACGQDDNSPQATSTTVDKSSRIAPVKLTTVEAARLLQMAQFSSTPDEVAALIDQGYSDWLNNQMATPEGQTGTQWLMSRNHHVPTTSQNFFSGAAGDNMIWHQLINSQQQMRQRIAFALSQFFVVSLTSLTGFWPAFQIAGYWDVLTRNAFGNYRTLLEEITLNPAMGAFLNTKGNKKANTAKGFVPDENYAREVMQLFSLGLYQLNNDGSIKTNLSGAPLETYTQDDITNLARVFTGYNWDMTGVTQQSVSGISFTVPTTEFTRTPMALKASNHASEEKRFLGTVIPIGTNGSTSLSQALDTLFNHPNVGPFFARQMIQRLVTSNPSSGYIGRVATAFNNNGSGVRGDLKAVWKAILTDPEATVRQAGSTAGKLREPALRLVQWARTFKLTSPSGRWLIGDLSNSATSLGQAPLRAPSVFNFFRPGYVPPQTDIATQNLCAPEFQLHNETSTSGYINFIASFIEKGTSDLRPDYSALLAIAHNATDLLNWCNLNLGANSLSQGTITIMQTALEARALTSTGSDANKLRRIYAAVLMTLCAPEYLIQK